MGPKSSTSWWKFWCIWWLFACKSAFIIIFWRKGTLLCFIFIKPRIIVSISIFSFTYSSIFWFAFVDNISLSWPFSLINLYFWTIWFNICYQNPFKTIDLFNIRLQVLLRTNNIFQRQWKLFAMRIRHVQISSIVHSIMLDVQEDCIWLRLHNHKIKFFLTGLELRSVVELRKLVCSIWHDDLLVTVFINSFSVHIVSS